jgi:hypothetical protein
MSHSTRFPEEHMVMPLISPLVTSDFPEYLPIVRSVWKHVQMRFTPIEALIGTNRQSRANHYSFYPYLFRKEFPQISDSCYEALAVASVFYLEYVCLLDFIHDTPNKVMHAPFLMSLVHEQGTLALASILPIESVFWEYFTQYHHQTVASMMSDANAHSNSNRVFTEEEFITRASGKAALSKMVTTALAILGDNTSRISCLAESQDWFNAAFQMYDDVKDWREDLICGRSSYLLNHVMIEGGFINKADRNECAQVIPDDVGQYIYRSGVAEEVLNRAIEWCKNSLDAVDGLDLDGWIRLVKVLQARLERLRNDFSRLRLAPEKHAGKLR